MSSTIVIAGADSGVDNEVFADGSSLADLANAVVETKPVLDQLVFVLVSIYERNRISSTKLKFVLEVVLRRAQR